MDRSHLLSVPVAPVTTSLIRVAITIRTYPIYKDGFSIKLAQERCEYVDLSNLSWTFASLPRYLVPVLSTASPRVHVHWGLTWG
jgi:hypothetical protein